MFKVAAIWLTLFFMKNVVLGSLDFMRALMRERRQVLRALLFGAVFGAVLGFGAAVRAEANVPLMTIGTALCVVLGQAGAAVMFGMHQQQQDWAFRVYYTAFTRFSWSQ